MNELYKNRIDINTPLVSIIIPVYNTCSYLSQCLESVLSQTYKKLEIIIVDDGSSDESGEICDRFAQSDSRVCVLHTRNCGLASARNLGIEKAEGSFLFFLDSDDWIESSTIRTLLMAAVKYEASIICATSCSEYVRLTVLPETKEPHIQSFQGKEILSSFVDGLFGDVIWNKLYQRDCFLNIRFPIGHNFEDLAVTWKIMTNLADNEEKVVAVQDILYHHRIRMSSILNTRSIRNIADQWKASVDKYEGLSEYKESLIPGCISVIGSMWINYYGFTKEDKKQAEGVIAEMQRFSKTHFSQVMRGSYPIQTKLKCAVSQSKAPIVLLCCHIIGRVWKMLRSRRYKMFD